MITDYLRGQQVNILKRSRSGETPYRYFNQSESGIFYKRCTFSPHPASYPMDIRGFFPGNKTDGAWSWPFISI